MSGPPPRSTRRRWRAFRRASSSRPSCTAAAGTACELGFRVAEVGFIGFDNLAFSAHRGQIEATLAHGFHNAVMQEPSRLVLAAQLAMELVGAKALLARGRQMEAAAH